MAYRHQEHAVRAALRTVFLWPRKISRTICLRLEAVSGVAGQCFFVIKLCMHAVSACVYVRIYVISPVTVQ